MGMATAISERPTLVGDSVVAVSTELRFSGNTWLTLEQYVAWIMQREQNSSE